MSIEAFRAEDGSLIIQRSDDPVPYEIRVLEDAERVQIESKIMLFHVELRRAP